MKKIVKISLLIVAMTFLSACGTNDEIEGLNVNDLVKQNAIFYEERDTRMGGNYVVYESTDNGEYKRKFAFDADLDFASGAIVVGNTVFIIHPEYIQSYSLEDGKRMGSHGNGIGGVGPYLDVYGIKNERVYLSYQPGDKKIYYTLDMNLENKEIIDKEDLPKQFDYEVCH